MSRSTIDFGIDLGTTNSAIAILNGVTPEIIQNNDSRDITPSAVAFSEKGAIRVGERAKNMTIDKEDDAYVEFKREMGTEKVYEFKSSGKKLKPEELSAEVLKLLKTNVQQRCSGEEINAAVITVPAIFELHQCDATRRAAELAGLKDSPFLLEPVAAALAYGFQADSEKAFWLVYDFGGGTFDAALIKAEEGVINVVNHGGDNFLGGSDIDRALVDKVIVPKIVGEYGLKDFTRSNAGKGQRWRTFFALMKAAAERAKIDLSLRDSAQFEILNLDRYYPDLGFDSFECDITRNDVIQVAEPIIRRSVEISLRVLSEKNLTTSALDRVIIVGGPTLAPYFREMLHSGLNANLDTSVNPLTVVAKGAAVFAGTQKVNVKHRPVAIAGEYPIELKYKPVGGEADPIVAGRVSATNGSDVTGFTLELVNVQTHWRSGKITLQSEGTFMLNLLAEKGSRNTFSIELLDKAGVRQKPVPDQLTYTMGMVAPEQTLTKSVGVVRANNTVARFFEKGAGLPSESPLKKKWPDPFTTVRALKQGDPTAALIIPVVEGENDIGDRNRCLGSYKISGTQIKRDVPAGSEVEVTLKINQSRILTVCVYIPLLDEEFDLPPIDLIKTTRAEPQLRHECEAEFRRLAGMLEKADNADDSNIGRQLREIQCSDLLRDVKENLEAASGDSAAAEKCESRLLELQLKLDEIENTLKWPATVAEVKEWRGYLTNLVDQHGTVQHRDRAQELEEEIDEIVRKVQMDRIPRKLDQIQQLYYQILFTVPAFWVNQFQRMEKEKNKMTDQQKAERLFEMGRNYLSNNNVAGLQNVVRQLWDLTPREVVEEAQREAQRGLQSTLI